MPILNDIMDHEVFGPLIRQGKELGRVEGRVEGERRLALRQLTQRFGALPDWARSRVEAMSPSDVERMALGLLSATSLEDLLP